MRHDRPTSDGDSGATPTIEPSRQQTRASESRFLEERVAEAQHGIARSARDIAATLGDLVPLRTYAVEHPWIVASSAVAIGVVAGALLTPTRRQHACRQPDGSGPVVAGDPQPAHAPAAQRAVPGMLHSIAGAILAAALPLLVKSWFTPAATSAPPGDVAAGGAPGPADPPAGPSGGE